MNRLFAKAPFASVCHTCLRGLATSEVKCVKRDLSKMKANQARFQMNPEVPIYLRGGTVDYVLFYAVVALTFVGLGTSIQALYKLSQK